MDCKIQGRIAPTPTDPVNPLDYGLEGMTTGQMRHAYIRANQYLQTVMMDPKSPPMLKELIRTQNAVSLLTLQGLMASFHKHEEE